MNKKSLVVLLAALFLVPNTAFSKLSKAERDLVIISHLDPGSAKTKQFWKDVYTVIEREGVNMVRAHIGRKYRKVHVLRSKLRDSKPTITLKTVVNLLNKVTKRSKTRTVDMMWMTHGLDGGRIQLQKTVVKEGDKINKNLSVEDDIAKAIGGALSRRQCAKFRMIFSTACWGASHIRGWLKVGFKAASGSRAVFTDAAASYPRFLNNWRAGRTFRKAVDKANTTQKHDLSDKFVAKLKRFSRFRVDSFRLTSGQTCMTIDSSPSMLCRRKTRPSKTRKKKRRMKMKMKSSAK